jgi:hypothetical protein
MVYIIPNKPLDLKMELVSRPIHMYQWFTYGEGIDSMFFTFPIFPRRQIPTVRDVVAAWTVYVLEHFWSFIIIFGLLAIRKWTRAR